MTTASSQGRRATRDGSAAKTAPSEFSCLVRELRARTGLTQEQFAAKLGVTFPTINRWENGRAWPSPLALQQVRKVVRALEGDGGPLTTRLDNALGQ